RHHRFETFAGRIRLLENAESERPEFLGDAARIVDGVRQRLPLVRSVADDESDRRLLSRRRRNAGRLRGNSWPPRASHADQRDRAKPLTGPKGLLHRWLSAVS